MFVGNIAVTAGDRMLIFSLCIVMIALPPGEECEANAVCCLSVWARNSKTITLIVLIFLHKKYYTRGSVLI